MNTVFKKNLVGILVDDVDRSKAADMVMEAAHQGSGLAVSAIAVHGVMTGVMDATHDIGSIILIWWSPMASPYDGR